MRTPCVRVLPNKCTVRKGVSCCRYPPYAKSVLKWKMNIKVKRIEKYKRCTKSKGSVIPCTHMNKVALTLTGKRIIYKNQNVMIERMQRVIDNNGVKIESDLQRSVGETMADKFTPFIRLLWAEQKKYYLQGSYRYRRTTIRFALSLAMKSATAYDELRKSGILILPSRLTLRDYKNAIKPSSGPNPHVIAVLTRQCEGLSNMTSLLL